MFCILSNFAFVPNPFGSLNYHFRQKVQPTRIQQPHTRTRTHTQVAAAPHTPLPLSPWLHNEPRDF